VLEVLPDGAPPSAAAEVTARIGELGRRCAELKQARADQAAHEAAMKKARAPLTPPRKLGCDGSGPRVPRLKSKRRNTTVSVHYTIRADGAVADVTSSSDAPRKLVDSILAFVKSCRFEAAKRGEEAIEIEMDEVYTLEQR
jgi:hypothetical protein